MVRDLLLALEVGVCRGAPLPRRGRHVRGSAAGSVVCYGCVKAGHLQRDCRTGGGADPRGCPPFGARGEVDSGMGSRSVSVGPLQ